MKKTIFTISALMFALCSFAQAPKYVFLFIGDGMGDEQIELTSTATSLHEGKDFTPSFCSFNHQGKATTHSADNSVTDSAAAGTALATGEKTKNGTIGLDSTSTRPLKSVAKVAKELGYSVGILTSVSLDHATPAAFYAHAPKRSMYGEIAQWLPKSGFDLFAGAGLKDISPSFYDSISSTDNYTLVRGSNAELSGEKIVWVQSEGKNVDNLPLAIDREQGDMTLSNMVEQSIDYLYEKSPKGIFMMVEGGQIDWAGHDNDAASIVHETLDFAMSVDVALAFYEKHPEQTLIIVTADHETGGLDFDRKDDKTTNPEKIFKQKGSLDVVGREKVDQTNKDAGAVFTTTNHTGVPVSIAAMGVGAENFAENLDNTDIPKIIEKLLKQN